MKKLAFILLVLVGCKSSNENPILGMEYLEKSIAYHDPNGNWGQAEMKLIFTEIDATRTELIREVSFSNPKGVFKYYIKDDEKELEISYQNDSCSILLNGSPEFSDADKEDYNLTCEAAKIKRDYYTYIYGLPMKLKDPGTIVHPDVIEEEFDGETFNSIRVTYDENVGKDIWYFYLDQETYALRGYRFQHNISEHDGEFITLDGLEEFNGMRIPKTRSWYVNRTGDYLATDELQVIEQF